MTTTEQRTTYLLTGLLALAVAFALFAKDRLGDIVAVIPVLIVGGLALGKAWGKGHLEA